MMLKLLILSYFFFDLQLFDNKSNTLKQAMIVSEQRTLMKNKPFVGVLVFGIVCAMTSVIIRSIVAGQVNSCLDDSFCSSSSHLCIQYGYAYCCSTYGSGSYSCGSYYNSCDYIGYNYDYTDCTGLIIAEWVMGSIALAALIALIVLAKKHQRQKLQQNVAQVYAQNNIIYSDAQRQRQPQPQPQQNYGVPRDAAINHSTLISNQQPRN